MSAEVYTTMPSPVGELLLLGAGGALTGIVFRDGASQAPDMGGRRRDPASFAAAVEQLEAYFAGGLRRFDLPLAPQGTPFQQTTWRALQDIPYGETRSYADIARAIGQPAAVRAVGAANGRNPLPIVIPCHRVVGSDGNLTGFGGGLAAKQKLLALEGSLTARMFF